MPGSSGNFMGKSSLRENRKKEKMLDETRCLCYIMLTRSKERERVLWKEERATPDGI